MLTRRVFLQAVASLAAVPIVTPPLPVGPCPYGASVVPAKCWRSWLRIYTEAGRLLADVAPVVEEVPGGYRFHAANSPILVSGTAVRWAWLLPNGELLAGTVGGDFTFNTTTFIAGGKVAFDGRYQAGGAQSGAV